MMLRTGGKTWRERLAIRLRWTADRIHWESAFMATSQRFTFEQDGGFVLNEEGRGCLLWYRGLDEYDKAHTEALNPPIRVDWTTLTLHPPGMSLSRRRRNRR